jgi:hypothetical protein
MSSASLRRSITSSDPRSPLQLSSLVTSFPQHQLITSFQTFQVSPLRYSPRRVNQSPIYARPPRALFHDNTSASPEQPSRLAKQRARSSSFAKLLAPRVPAEPVPGMCPCEQGSSRSVKHMVRDCPRLEAERARLISQDPESRRPLPLSNVNITAQQPQQQQNLVQIVRKRTRTLLGKVVDTQKDREDKRPALTAVI